MPHRSLQARGPLVGHAPQLADHVVAGVVLRDAVPADIDAIVALTNAAYAPRDGLIFGRDRTDAADVRAAIEGPASAIIVAAVDVVVAAAVRLDIVRPDAHFGPLATAPPYQGRGLAPALIRECERRARAAGCVTMHIGVIREVGMQPYYESLGYRYASETPGHELSWGANTPQPFTLVHMQKQIRNDDQAGVGPLARVPDAAYAARVSFRAATFDDIPALVPMINTAYLRESHVIPGPRITETELREQITAPHSRVLVAEIGNATAGCIRVRLLDDGAWFGLLATHVAHQGRGLASLLIAEAERVARAEGRTTMHLECAEELGMPPYYASLGYEIETIEPEYYFTSPGPPPRRKGPIQRVIMRKGLA